MRDSKQDAGTAVPVTAMAEDGATGDPPALSRIQRRNRRRILDAALDAFSERGFAGATLERIAERAGLSKPNLFYYFASKEAIHAALLTDLLETWLAPLAHLDPEGDPRAELLGYVSRKLQMSRDMPRESRLFASEIFQGAPRLGATLAGPLKALVDDKAAVIARWQAEGRVTSGIDPHHLIMSVWALTQHYADFEVQTRAVLGENRDPWTEAEGFLARFYGGVVAG